MVNNNSKPDCMKANCGTGLNEPKDKQYKFSEVPTEFRNNNTWNHAMSEINVLCFNRVHNEAESDTLYKSTCDTLLKEWIHICTFLWLAGNQRKGLK